MTVRGGGIPRRPLAFMPNGRMGPPLRSFAADAHDCIMVRVLGPTEYKVVARLIRAPQAGSPSDRHRDRIRGAVVLEAVKVWPGKRRARGKVGATANLDSSCARRLCNTAGRGEETGFQVEQRNRSRKQERKIAALKPLDNKSPIQGVACKRRARGEPSATASLDGPCARRPGANAGRDEGTASWHEQRNCTDEEPEMTNSRRRISHLPLAGR